MYFSSSLFGLTQAFAVTGTVNTGKIDPLPIAITPFIASQGAQDQAASVAGIIANDLARSGYFKPLPPESFIEQIATFDQQPNFGSWRQVKAQDIVVGQVSINGDRMTVAFKLYDVNTQSFLAGSSSLGTGQALAPPRPQGRRHDLQQDHRLCALLRYTHHVR